MFFSTKKGQILEIWKFSILRLLGGLLWPRNPCKSYGLFISRAEAIRDGARHIMRVGADQVRSTGLMGNDRKCPKIAKNQ